LSTPEFVRKMQDLPLEGDAPVFREPWEARVFAMTLSAHEAGLFSWSEWAETLGAEIKSAGSEDTGAEYYRHWLAAFEKLLAGKGATSAEGLAEMQAAWDRAARATPHGEPIVLGADKPD
jgi:nitrile hydratase accessory protein